MIIELVPMQDFAIADLTHESVVGKFGIYRDLFAGNDYRLTQEWAAALWDSGYQGVQYFASHHPGFKERSVALFAKPGIWPDLLKSGLSVRISDELLARIKGRFDIGVVSCDSLPWRHGFRAEFLIINAL